MDEKIKRPAHRPKKTEGEYRHTFVCRVKESNLAWMRQASQRSGRSIGELTDHAIDLLRQQEALLMPTQENGL